MNETKSKGSILVIYTGGTIGSVRKNPDNPESPLIPGTKEDLISNVPAIKRDRILLEEEEIVVKFEKTKRLIDSSMIKPSDWVEIAEIIERNYEEHEGFVILHGTDTMAYTASALAFMIDHLDKPIVITGSQRPIGYTRNDAEQNLVTAIEIAAAQSLGKRLFQKYVFFLEIIY